MSSVDLSPPVRTKTFSRILKWPMLWPIMAPTGLSRSHACGSEAAPPWEGRGAIYLESVQSEVSISSVHDKLRSKVFAQCLLGSSRRAA